MELSPNQLHRLLERFPSFELSYETLTHKKVPDNYNICLGVPSGRKYFLWFTFYRDQDVCYLLELNKEKRITRATITHTEFSRECHIGTILYGSLVRDEFATTTNTPETAQEPRNATSEHVVVRVFTGEDSSSRVNGRVMKPYFVIEDLYFYKGIPLKHICFAEKIPLLKRLFERDRTAPFTYEDESSPRHITPVYLPFMWRTTDPAPNFPYGIHHIQYRELHRICPYLNVIYGLSYTRSTNTHASSALTCEDESSSVNIQTPMRVPRSGDFALHCSYANTEPPAETRVPATPPFPGSTPKSPEIFISQYVSDYHKPQYKYPTIFRVIADIQYDIYHLYACGQSKPAAANGRQHPRHSRQFTREDKSSPALVPRSGAASRGSYANAPREFVYYDVAYIPNYKTSVFMNGLFRNIRENRNLDYIEESDDEEDFEDTREDKYVDTKKELFIECVFHTKFKRWVPTRVADKREKVVHIHKLAR
jgi:hypothetical protein